MVPLGFDQTTFIDNMDITPAPTPVPGGDKVGASAARSFGGLLCDLVADGQILRHNIHDHAAVIAALDGFARGRVVKLEIFAVPTADARDHDVLYMGWGHCEHSFPTDLDGVAQLPAFLPVIFSENPAEHSSRTLACPFVSSINPVLKPIMLEGGRPSVFTLVEGKTDSKKVVAKIFYRITIDVSGVDVVIA